MKPSIRIPTRIYVASSWRNERQPVVVNALRDDGHKVYDFRNPAAGTNGFSWDEIDPNWREWSTRAYIAALDHTAALEGFNRDHAAMEWADVFVMVLPCGKSAHLELGWACGKGKHSVILMEEREEPELMYLEADIIVTTIPSVLSAIRMLTFAG